MINIKAGVGDTSTNFPLPFSCTCTGLPPTTSPPVEVACTNLSQLAASGAAHLQVRSAPSFFVVGLGKG